MTKCITCDNIESSKRKSGERYVWRKSWGIDKINTSLHCKNGVILDRDSCFDGFGYCNHCENFVCVIQTFAFESGLGDNWKHDTLGHDEMAIDWFAIQYPKIKTVFKQLGVEA